jgi:hypothetical protein
MRESGMLDSQARLAEAIRIARILDGSHTIHNGLILKR